MADSGRPVWVDDQLFPLTSRFVTLDRHTVHYVDEGSGPTLLFLHGNPTWSFDYREVIRALRDEFRSVALDYPGFGLSSAGPGYRYLPEEHAAVVVDFLAKERQRWEQIFADHHTVIIEGAGYFVQSDAPEEFAVAIRGWRLTPDGRRTSPAHGDIRRETPRKA